MLEKPEVVLQVVLQRKIFFSFIKLLQRKNILFFQRSFAKKKYSFLKSIFTKTSQICDIHERNYIIFEVSFFNRDIDMLINHDESFIFHG